MAKIFHRYQLPHALLFAGRYGFYDKEKGNPLAAWVKWTAGKHTFDTAVFSGTYDDYIGGWEDSKIYYGSWLGDFSEGSSTNYSSTGFPIISRMALSERIVSLEVTNGPCLLLTEWSTGPWSLHGHPGVWRQW